MMNCRDVSTIVAEGALESLPVRRRLAVWVHLAMCRYCRAFRRQIRALDQEVRGAADRLGADAPPEFESTIVSRALGRGGPSDDPTNDGSR